MLDIDKDMSSVARRLLSPISSLPSSRSATPFRVHLRHERTTTPSSPRIQHEHTTSPPPHIRRERTTPPPSPRTQRMCTTPSSPRSEANTDLLAPPQKRTRLPLAPFRQGYTPGPKPKASDYEDCVEKILLNTMHKYACLILTTDAFPNEVKQTQWAEATWRAACEEVGVHYACSVHMIRLVRLQHYYHF